MAARLEVAFINRSNRHNAFDGIENVGGKIGSKVWKNSAEVVIDWIEHGLLSYYVKRDGLEVDVIVAKGADGHKYLKTRADGERPDSLLALPECPK
ncbi:MAG TPA: DUF3892 domain-containing protein [Candidatus Cybelea sp.]|jgi:hypothetical protein|nr:DUF3892 domain-containing protein [Candidatus Cybelea sp.]